MTAKRPVLVSWSGGKDSCLALYEIQRSGKFAVKALQTTLTRDFDRISMHGVRRALLEDQALSLGIPVQDVTISKNADNAEYEAELGKALDVARCSDLEAVVFGDIFLADIRAYRESLLRRHGLAGLFPLWGCDTEVLIQDFLNLGFKAVAVCVEPAKLDPAFAGRVIDEAFLADLPSAVDPCGENGEFHTFVFDGPNFSTPVKFTFGEIVCRDAFWFCDLVPEDSGGRMQPC
jgi:uncharacterized protein (TIGR00290 family)